AGQLGGGLFADSSPGWRGAFFALGTAYAVVALLLLIRVRNMPAPAAAPAHTRIGCATQLRSVLQEPWARKVLIAVLIEGAFLLGPLAYLPAYVHLRFGLSLAAASALIALYAIGGLLYALAARRIVPRLGERRMVLLGGLLMGGGFLAWLLAPLGELAGPIALLVGFGTYLYHNTLQTHATQMVPAMRATAVALFAFCLFVGQAIGVTAAGYAFDHWGYVPLLLAPALALTLAGWWFARALQRRAAQL